MMLLPHDAVDHNERLEQRGLNEKHSEDDGNNRHRDQNKSERRRDGGLQSVPHHQREVHHERVGENAKLKEKHDLHDDRHEARDGERLPQAVHDALDTALLDLGEGLLQSVPFAVAVAVAVAAAVAVTVAAAVRVAVSIAVRVAVRVAVTITVRVAVPAAVRIARRVDFGGALAPLLLRRFDLSVESRDLRHLYRQVPRCLRRRLVGDLRRRLRFRLDSAWALLLRGALAQSRVRDCTTHRSVISLKPVVAGNNGKRRYACGGRSRRENAPYRPRVLRVRELRVRVLPVATVVPRRAVADARRVPNVVALVRQDRVDRD